MSFSQQISLLNRIHALIQRKGTGTPEELANRLDISRASLFRHISTLKEFGAPIEYSLSRRSYIYSEHFELDYRNAI